jgi:hypothetical protein
VDFADVLKNALARPRPASLRGALGRAGLALAGLAGLPLLASGGPAVRTAAAVALFGGLAFFALRALAARTAPAENAVLRVAGRASLSPRTHVALVEVDNRRLVVAYGDGFATLLSAIDTAAPGGAP